MPFYEKVLNTLDTYELGSMPVLLSTLIDLIFKAVSFISYQI